MAKPTQKSPEVEAKINAFSGSNRQESIRSNTCAWCSGPAAVFSDSLSRKEYTISGMCQACQEKAYPSDEEDEAEAFDGELDF